MQVDRGLSIRHGAVLPALAERALREDDPALEHGLDSADHVRVDLASGLEAQAVRCHLRERLRVRSARQDVRDAAISSIRRPRKAR